MAEPVNVLDMTPSDFKTFLDSFDYVFSDCDGVLWSGAPLPKSGEFIEKMKKLGKSVHFVSNNSIRTRENYESKFKAAGIENGFDNLTVPSIAMAEYLKSINFDKKIYCVSCPETVRVLERAGWDCVVGPETGADNYADYIQYLRDDLDVGAVVFDSDYKVNLPRLYKALTYLKRPDVIFLSGATDKYVPLQPGSLILATGIFTDIVVAESKRKPVLLGKPGQGFAEFAMKRAGATNPSRVLFIGDMIDQDVGLGKAAGFKTLCY
ncbi:hypothetical protein ACJJTC_001622 [Scirpophaga incertulas]